MTDFVHRSKAAIVGLSACLAEPDDLRTSVYREAERRALERVRAGYPDELRPADVTVFG